MNRDFKKCIVLVLMLCIFDWLKLPLQGTLADNSLFLYSHLTKSAKYPLGFQVIRKMAPSIMWNKFHIALDEMMKCFLMFSGYEIVFKPSCTKSLAYMFVQCKILC